MISASFLQGVDTGDKHVLAALLNIVNNEMWRLGKPSQALTVIQELVEDNTNLNVSALDAVIVGFEQVETEEEEFLASLDQLEEEAVEIEPLEDEEDEDEYERESLDNTKKMVQLLAALAVLQGGK